MNEFQQGMEPGNSGKKPPLAGVNPLLFILLSLITIFITYQIFGGILTVIFFGGDIQAPGTDATSFRLIMAFSQFMFILFPVLMLNYLQGKSVKKTFRLKRPNIPVLLLSIVGVVLIQPFLQGYLIAQEMLINALPFGADALNSFKEAFDALESMTLNLVTAQSLPEFILVVFVIAVTPAICEEFFFRGIILKNFERITKPLKAILFTGLLFAFFHFHPFHIVPLIALGYFLSFIVFYSGSIYPAIICHFLNNFFAAYSVYSFGSESLDESNFSADEKMYFLIVGAVTLILFILLMKYIKKISPYNKIEETPEQDVPAS